MPPAVSIIILYSIFLICMPTANNAFSFSYFSTALKFIFNGRGPPLQHSISQTFEHMRQGTEGSTRSIIGDVRDQIRESSNSIHSMIDKFLRMREDTADDFGDWLTTGHQLAIHFGANMELLGNALNSVGQGMNMAPAKGVHEIELAWNNLIKGIEQNAEGIEGYKEKLILSINDHLDVLAAVLDQRAHSFSNAASSGWYELLYVLKEFQQNLSDLRNEATSKDFIFSLFDVWSEFIEVTLKVTEQHSALKSVYKAINRTFELWEMANSIMISIVILVQTLIGFLFFKVANRRAPTIITWIGVIFIVFMTILLILILPVPNFTTQTPSICTSPLHLIHPRDHNIPESPLIIDKNALSILRQLHSPIWVYSESGPFNSGKSTALSIILSVLLSPEYQSRCFRSLFFRARSRGEMVDGGLTRGLHAIAIPRYLIDYKRLPEPLRTAYQNMHDSLTEGTLVFLDSQGTDDGEATQGEVELIELLTVLLSSHHTFARLTRFHDQSGYQSLARIGQLLKVAESLSSPEIHQCSSGKSASMKSTSRPSFSLRVKDGHSTDSVHMIDCMKMNDDNDITAVEPGCSFHVQVVSKERSSILKNLKEEVQELVYKYFNDAYALIQPKPLKDELMAISSLNKNSYDLVHKCMNSHGITYSISHHHLPWIINHSSKKSVNGELVAGAEFVNYLEGTFNALTALSKSNIRIFSATEVSLQHTEIRRLINDFSTIWLDVNSSHAQKGTMGELYSLFPMESTPPCTSKNLCPAHFVEREFSQRVNSLQQSLCVFESMLDKKSKNESRQHLLERFDHVKRELLEAQLKKCVYKWKLSEWSKCAGKCNGIQTRTVSCENEAGESRKDSCCSFYSGITEPSIRECIPPAYTYSWESPRSKDWSNTCPNNHTCTVALFPEYEYPTALLAGEKTASFWCKRCSDEVSDEECLQAIGSKPKDVIQRCFPDQNFYTASPWDPSNCHCGQTQSREVACVNCYGEQFPLETCGMRSYNTPPVTQRLCVGFQWYKTGSTKCNSTRCGVTSEIYQCFPCTGKVPFDNGYCADLSTPVSTDSPCNQDYKWEYNQWPTTCNCEISLSRNVLCKNQCDEEYAGSHLCSQPEPLSTCTCPSCPFGSGYCAKHRKWWHGGGCKHWVSGNKLTGHKNPTPCR